MCIVIKKNVTRGPYLQTHQGTVVEMIREITWKLEDNPRRLSAEQVRGRVSGKE